MKILSSKMIKPLTQVLAILFFLLSSEIRAGDSTSLKHHTVGFETQMIQVKDDFNYGLVYSGIQLNAIYALEILNQRKELEYSAKLGFGANLNKGAGLAWKFIPIDILYRYRLKSKVMAIGGYFLADYNWQQYSELQGGRLFWYTSLELGAEISFSIPVKKRTINLSISNSIAGFNSRPKPSTEVYFYDFSFKEFFSAAHRNLTFGSFNQFNHTRLNVELNRKQEKRFSAEYGFEYIGYYKNPGWNHINHTIGLKWKIGKLK